MWVGGERHPAVVESFRTFVTYPPWTDLLAFSPTFRHDKKLEVILFSTHVSPHNSDGSPLVKPGDSGGVCINERGQVLGICVAADEGDQQVHYAVITPIKTILDAWELHL